MKTAEEILDQADDKYVIGKGVEIVVRDAALTAMEEYASQFKPSKEGREEAVGFADAIMEIDSQCAMLEDYLHGEEGKRITKIRTMLQRLYLQSKNTKQNV